MQRRTFLKITLAAAGATLLGGGAGCDDGGAAQPQPKAVEPGEALFPQSVASGDPRPDSVILWTRAVDPAAPADDLPVLLEVATDPDFTALVELDGAPQLALTAEAAADHCLKVRVAGLTAGTTYYYRFLVPSGDVLMASRAGRTRTAPAADADVPARFAFVSCQDFNGKYYNPYRLLLQQDADLDFVLHLGDYVYETTSDPLFQDAHPGRAVAFTDVDGAIALGDPAAPYHAARSLDNYRELYKIYRSDPDLQAVHERWPMIAVWDDHEFSNDAWQQHGTYANGRTDEADVARRKAANQAWSEHMPVGEPALTYDPAAPFPGDLRIYRDFGWGAHAHVVMTDARSYRADHLIPEDALPGAVALTQDDLVALAGEVPGYASAYVDIDTHAEGSYLDVLKNAAEAEGYDPARITGLLSVSWVNGVVERFNQTNPDPVVIPSIDPDGLPLGVAFHHMGKNTPYASIGTRDLVVREPFELWAAKRWADSDGASQHILGDAQQAWFLETMQTSTRTWKLWGNPYCLMPLGVDLRPISSLPPAFAQKFLLSAEDWAGMPDRADQVMTALAPVDNVVALTGDRHAFFAGTPHARGDKGARVPEFVTSGISSTTYRSILIRAASADPILKAAGAVALAAGVKSFLEAKDTKPNPHLAFAEVASHGCAVVDLSAAELVVTFHALPEGEASARLDDPVAVATATRFKVLAGSRDLYGEVDGGWKRWDLETVGWV